eukprot:4505041-Amphidinium_carterae.1
MPSKDVRLVTHTYLSALLTDPTSLSSSSMTYVLPEPPMVYHAGAVRVPSVITPCAAVATWVSDC